MNRSVLGGGNSSTAPASDVFARPPPIENPAIHYPSSTGGVDMELPEKRPPATSHPLPPPEIPQAPRTAPANVMPSFPTHEALNEANMSLDDLADAFLRGANETSAVCLSPDPLPAEASDMQRLEILVRRRAWKDALSYTKLFLETGSKSHYSYLYDAILAATSTESSTRISSNSAIDLALDTHKQDLVYIMTVRVTAMVKMSSYSELAEEVERWTFCFHHSQPRRLFSWIPWTFHILAASTLQYGRFGTSAAEAVVAASQQQCLDALWAIRDAITDDTEVDAQIHVENTLHNIFIAMKDWRMALDSQQRILELVPKIAGVEATKLCLKPSATFPPAFSEQALTTAYRLECLARQGRIFLQIGLIDQAEILFQQSRDEWNIVVKNDTTASLSQGSSLRNVIAMFVSAQLSSNDGLLHFSLGKYEEALESFRAAVVELKSALSTPPSETRETQTDLLESRQYLALYSESMNNMSLCALYTCRLAEALHLMEALVRENVTEHLTERVTLNLCTLYELSMDSNVALRKKKVLQHIASRFLLQDIPVECFRVG